MADADDDESPPKKEIEDDSEDSEEDQPGADGGEAAWEDDESESELEVTVTSSGKSTKGQTSFQDPEIFMSYTPRTTNAAEERAYGVNSGGTTQFVEAARDAAMDLNNDEGAKAFGLPTRSKLRWDKRHSKYVARANDDDGSRGAKMIRGESGVKIAASFQSGRFDKWRRANKLGRLPGVGEAEKSNLVRNFNGGGGPGGGNNGHYKHKQEKAPKDADKFRDDYHVRKKRVAEAREKRVGKYKDGEGSRRELKSATDIRKARQVAERKREKNARPVKRAKR
jgi:ATP-dependent RNA helicase DDX54/DBP10